MREKINRFGFVLLRPFVGLMISGSTRTRALILHRGKVLLVRGWFGSQTWGMPGGGVRKNENSKKGLKRELREELGINAQPKQFRQIMKVEQEEHNTRFTSIVYQIDLQTKTKFKIRRSELIEAAWHKINNLPDNLHPLVKEALKIRKK